jgi:hypothetical protein
VAVRTLTAQGRYGLAGGIHAAEAGWNIRRLRFEDRLDESDTIRGNVNGVPTETRVNELFDTADLSALQVGFFAQDALDLHPTSGRLVATVGLRADYYDFNGQWTVSPRASATYLLTTQTTLLGSVGVYHQAPTYRELRGRIETGRDAGATGAPTDIEAALNRDLKAQRSVQVVAGVEHLLARRQLWLRAEAFYKHLSNLVSYDIENVRVLYSGENDSDGATYGLDVQLRGEFVPGSESWVNYSYLKATEDFRPQFEVDDARGYLSGDLARPTDQRHTISLYVQDYIPRDPTWKIHLRALYGSGLPYTPPVPRDETVDCSARPNDPDCVGQIEVQVPGPRNAFRFESYKRFDMGVTKRIEFAGLRGSASSQPIRLEFTGEVLNVFDMSNTVAYSWTPGDDSIWRRIPTRLTPRTFNLRFRVTF